MNPKVCLWQTWMNKWVVVLLCGCFQWKWPLPVYITDPSPEKASNTSPFCFSTEQPFIFSFSLSLFTFSLTILSPHTESDVCMWGSLTHTFANHCMHLTHILCHCLPILLDHSSGLVPLPPPSSLSLSYLIFPLWFFSVFIFYLTVANFHFSYSYWLLNVLGTKI